MRTPRTQRSRTKDINIHHFLYFTSINKLDYVYLKVCYFIRIYFIAYRGGPTIQNRRKRKANRDLNPKRSKIFGAKSNCGTAS